MEIWAAPFEITHWHAWSPAAQTREAWLEWAKEPFSTNGEGSPVVEGMQAMNRRRLKQLGKLALDPAYRLPPTDNPIIFSNQFGDLTRSYELLKELTETGAISPQSFGLSVHNAIPGLYTIDKKLHSNVTALASTDGVMSALIEALGLFAQGETSVRIIVVENAVQPEYKNYCDYVDESYGFAMDVTPGGNLQLAFSASANNQAKPVLPSNLNIFRFLITGDTTFSEVINNTLWQMRRVS